MGPGYYSCWCLSVLHYLCWFAEPWLSFRVWQNSTSGSLPAGQAEIQKRQRSLFSTDTRYTLSWHEHSNLSNRLFSQTCKLTYDLEWISYDFIMKIVLKPSPKLANLLINNRISQQLWKCLLHPRLSMENYPTLISSVKAGPNLDNHYWPNMKPVNHGFWHLSI